jgi:hypothetical protein
MSEYISRLRKYVSERLPRYNRSFMRSQMDKARRQQPRMRTPVTDQSSVSYIDRVVQPPHDYRVLCIYALFNPVLRMVHEAIIREVVKRGGEGSCG